MNVPDRLGLTSESWKEHFRNRSFFVLLQDFLPRSIARRDIRLDPEISWEEVSRLLVEFQDFDLELHRRSWRMALKRGGHVVEIDCARGRTHVETLSDSRDAMSVLQEVCKLLDPRVSSQDQGRADGVWADFCLSSKYGARTMSQFVRCPPWAAIRENYAPGTRSAIEALLSLPDPVKRGQLVIWHGPTGTGKTFALRAAMLAWRDRFVPTVLSDPERFARHPEYYLELASEPKEDFPDLEGILDETRQDSGRSDEPRPRHRLFILEDSASLLLRHGEKESDVLGRLFNMTDGLLGQGREDLFLITFNEEVDQIDPAFLRPGRCIAHIRFPRLPPALANEWLRQHGREASPVVDSASLADLYAQSSGGPIQEEPDETLDGPKGFGQRRQGSKGDPS